ncbi:MAG: glycosyltransferase family 2 protein, partial [Pseudomonadota bacterium]|nr:glycosyltransferase family 2 protein [Pseudomonadota bacterium]
SDHIVHERVLVHEGSTGKLTTPMIHYSYRNDSDFLRKLEQYSELGARQAFAAGKRGTLRKALLHALSAFLRSLVFKRGFLDGRAGLIVALCAAETTYHKYFKLMLLSEAEHGRRPSVHDDERR